MNKLLCAVLLPATMMAHAGDAPEITIDPASISVSGISAGGAMAHQLHIAYPEIFSGAAVIAGPPYGCADGNLNTAFSRCMAQAPGGLPVSELADSIRVAFSEGKIGDPEGLRDDRVWLFHASGDTVIAAEVSDALADLYAEFVEPNNLVYVTDFKAAHLFPTLDQGSDCQVSVTPYLGNCKYDAAGELLGQLYPGLDEPGEGSVAAAVAVDLPGAEDALLEQTAWLYIPPACAGDTRVCRLHLALHGCAQSVTEVGNSFIEQAGYLPWAQANDIVLAFPQVKPSTGNPLACWDWWGYTGPEYRWRDGAQMRVLADWISDLAGLQRPDK